MRKLSISLLIASVALLLIGAASTTTSFFKNISASGNVAGTNWSATGTAADRIPVGTTAQQPAILDGLIRYNSTTARFEHGTGGSWKNFVRLDGDTMTGSLLFTDGLYSIGASAATRPTNIYVNGGFFAQKDALAATTLPGLTLSNATASVNGTQQYSPAIYQSGYGFGTTGSSNDPVIFRSYVKPVQGTTPSSQWVLESSINLGAFQNSLTYDSSGNLTAATAVLAPAITASSGNVSAAAAGGVGITGKSYWVSSANGALEAINNAGSLRATVQANQPQVTKTANYTLVALDSGLRVTDIGAASAHTNTLPTAVAGQHFYFYQDTAQIMDIRAVGSDTIRNAATVSAAAGDIYTSAIGSTLHLFCPKATVWVIDTLTGTWTGPQ